MRNYVIINAIGYLLIILGISMFLPLAWAIYCNGPEKMAFIIPAFSCLILGLIFIKSTPAIKEIKIKEGFAIVSFCWLIAALVGSIPFIISGTFSSFADAFYEAMSGFTTTGATVSLNVEAMPQGILLWRSLTQWLGGMGIIVLFIALLSSLGGGANQMFKAESPGSSVVEKLKPRISESAKILWYTYVILTIILLILLLASGMNFFDSLCHALSTMASGGFSVKNESIGYYNNPLIEWIIILFMFLAGINFSLYYLLIREKNFISFWKNEEFKTYTFIILFFALLIGINLYSIHKEDFSTILEIVRVATFHTVSIITSTGFTTNDFNMWPAFSKMLLFILTFIGGCAGSTSGGIKVGRILILFKAFISEIKKLLHPRAILSLKINKKSISNETLLNITVFFFIYICIFFLGSIVLVALGLDMVSALTAVASNLGNTGPGLNKVGPMANYSEIPSLGKYFLSFLMLLGRLELYTVLVLFLPSTWKK